MSILNVNQIQPVGSGQTVTISAANITASSSTITASSFVGGVTVTSGNLTGISSVSTTNLTVNGNAIASTGPLSNRNLIINGSMQVAQRGTSQSSVTSTGYYTCDRWYHSNTGLGTWTLSQSTTAPSGFANSFKWDCTTADASPAAGDLIIHQQRIESQNLQHLKKGTSDALPVTLSFWVRSNKTGTYTLEIYDDANTRSIGKTYTIDSADTWEYKTITIEGDTTGTLDNDNTRGFDVLWWLGAGSNYTSGTFNTSWAAVTTANRVSSSQVNLGDSTSNEWYITGVQLEVGTVATPFEHRNISDELYRCRRYYQKSYPHNIAPGNVTSGQRAGDFTFLEGGNTTVAIMLRFEPEMRALPTVTTYSFHNANTANKVTASTTDYTSSTNSAVNSASRYIITATGVTAADDVYCAYTAEAEL